ncbi:MAG: polysaccharide biosynthesis tyrosine autokinase [Rhodobacteraceae bacterium]|nr:polysaccharide biosynthesis tyrosine autokinase [Paracoccaceae bacterium]
MSRNTSRAAQKKPADVVRPVRALVSTASEKAADLVDLGFIVDVLRREKWMIAAFLVAAVLLAIAYLTRVEPVYQSTAQVLLDTRQERVLNTEQVVSNLTANSSVVAGEVELIRSNLLLGKVVDRLELLDHTDYDPRLPQEAGAVGAVVAMIRDRLGMAEPPAEVMSDATARERLITRLQRDVTVSQVGISYAIRINARAHDAAMAALIANTIAAQYVDDQLEAKRDATVRATGFLNERVRELGQQLEAADSAVVTFRTEMTEELGGDAAATQQLLNDLNTRYIATRIERSDAEFRHAMVRSLYESGGVDAVADVVSSPLLATLDRERAELERRKAEMARTLGARHPQMVGMTAQIDDINRSIEAELRRQIEAIRSDMEMAAHRQGALLQAMEAIQDRMARISTATITLDQLERSAAAIRDIHESSLTRFMETTAQTGFQRPDAQIISIARTPSAPSEPRKAMLLGVAAFLGLMAGIATAFLREALNKSVHSSDALRALVNLPVVSILPYVPHKRRDRRWLLQEVKDNHSVFMESVRTIRAKLFDVRKVGQPKVLMVTSAIAGEGKSTVSAMLAYSLARASKSVVLIDADLRRSVTAQDIDADPKGGCLLRYLRGETTIADSVQSLPDLGFDIVLPLQPAENASDLIASRAFGDLIQRLSMQYDVVIVDTAPVLAVSDALVISSKSDATLMLVQTNRAASAMVRAALQRLEEAGAVVVGTVLSQVRRKDAVASEIYSYSAY